MTGMAALQAKLKHMQTPKFIEETVDKKYKHIRCPTHGQITKHKVNASKTTATPTYCCDELKALYQAARTREGSVRVGDDAEVPVQEPEGKAEGTEAPPPEDPAGGSTPTS